MGGFVKPDKSMKELKIITFALVLFFGIWAFNHINAWIGIALFLLPFYLTIKFLRSKTKQKNEKSN